MLLSLGGAVFAATASGDIVGLTDALLWGAPRPNVYTANLNASTQSYTLNIWQVQDLGGGSFGLLSFPTAADALSVTWTQNTSGMYNGFINTISYSAVAAPGGGYYLSLNAYNRALNIGPDSWRAVYTSAISGDFSFVATDYLAQDSGEVNNIQIEFYDTNPQTSTAFAAGSFNVVDGNDDYTSITGDHGRSYPTPLDSVAHGTDTSPLVISTYHKFYDTQDIRDIVDTSGKTHPAQPFEEGEGWLYAVYYPLEEQPGLYERDEVSGYVGYDDYLLKKNALVIFAIGDFYDLGTYYSYFPDQIKR
jgi:hypothetical protein